MIEHPKLGVGIIEKIHGSKKNLIADVNFEEYGLRSIMLKFARLKIVE